MGSNARHEAIKTISSQKHKLDHVDFKTTHIKNLFAVNVFSEEVAATRLPKQIFKALQKTIRKGIALDPTIADAVAAAMKDWAMEHGATHYTHLFQPMTGITAEKHDSFFGSHHWRRRGDFRIQRQGTGQRRTRCQLVPIGRACARHLKPVATPPGTQPAPRTSLKTRTAPRSSSQPRSFPGPVKHLIKRPRCCDRWKRSTRRRFAS